MEGITFRTTDVLKWGTGKGSALTNTEADENFWVLLDRIKEIEDNPVEAVSVEDITSDGSSLTIIMSNGVEYGPFALPVATFSAPKPWTNSQPLSVNDLITDPESGLYLVLVAHTTEASGSFNPALEISGDPAFQQVFGVPKVLNQNMPLSIVGLVGGGEALLAQFLINVPLKILDTAPDSIAYLNVAPTAEVILTLQKNGVEFGNVTFEATENVGVVDVPTETTFASGDRITIIGPDASDATAEHLSVTLSGVLV